MTSKEGNAPSSEHSPSLQPPKSHLLDHYSHRKQKRIEARRFGINLRFIAISRYVVLLPVKCMFPCIKRYLEEPSNYSAREGGQLFVKYLISFPR